VGQIGVSKARHIRYTHVSGHASGQIKTMRHWIYIIILIASCSKTTSEDSKELTADNFFPFNKESFDWTKVEAPIDNKEKLKFGEERPWLTSMHGDTYLSDTHAIDINDDGRLDLIYSGPGPVTYYTIVSLGNGGDDFSFEGYIVDLQIKNKKVTKLYFLSNVASGAPPVDRQTIVEISYKDKQPIFKTIFKNETIGGIQFPNQRTSYEIETFADTLIARDAPLELDTPYDYIIEIEGNRLGLLTKGTKARVIGEQTDSLKHLWLCALIYPKHKIIKYPYMNNQFDSTDGTTRMVWIRDKGLKKTD